jgi:hypothetical protein
MCQPAAARSRRLAQFAPPSPQGVGVAGAVPIATFVTLPSVTTTGTSSAHPEGSSADPKCKVDMFQNRLDEHQREFCIDISISPSSFSRCAREFELRLQGASYEAIARAKLTCDPLQP